MLDLSPLHTITVHDDNSADIGAGARLSGVYRALHGAGRTLPAGCGATVGIAGLTLGGGIGLLGRSYGLTCDRLRSVRLVLADGRIVECDRDHEPELFWALRGAGGGQFGVVTSLRFETVAEPEVIGTDAAWQPPDPAVVVAAWQMWAPDVADALTLNLTLDRGPDGTIRARLLGASLLSAAATSELMREWCDILGPVSPRLRGPIPYSSLKDTLVDRDRSFADGVRIRSEFFARGIGADGVAALVAELERAPATSTRRLSFTAMGGAYNRVAQDATAFPHRGERFLLEHVGTPHDSWVDESWSIAHSSGSGRVYPNFPDLALPDPLRAYDADNLARLSRVKQQYDPHRFFDFPQAIQPTGTEPSPASTTGKR